MRDQIVEAEDEQTFLQRLASVEVASPKRTPAQKQAADGADGNSPLVSFFNNLLKTKEGQVKVEKSFEIWASSFRLLNSLKTMILNSFHVKIQYH